MANFNSNQVATLRGKTKADAADNTTDRVVKPYQLHGRRRVAQGSFTCADEAAGSVFRMVWLPFGAVILGGRIAHGDMGATATFAIGVLGVSGTTYDNDADLLRAAATMDDDGAEDLPSAALLAANANYEITDPEGAYIIITTAAAVAATGELLVLDIEYVLD